jgi:hypothetical protein
MTMPLGAGAWRAGGRLTPTERSKKRSATGRSWRAKRNRLESELTPPFFSLLATVWLIAVREGEERPQC